MNYIGITIDPYRVIKSYKPRGTSTTIYVLENITTHKTIEIYYCTFKRLINGQTTIEKILNWRNSRKTKSKITKKVKIDLSLYHNLKMPYGYRYKNEQIQINKNEAETVQYIFYCFDRLHYAINRIAKTLNLSYTKTKNIIDNREFYQGSYKGSKHVAIIYKRTTKRTELTPQEMLFKLYHGVNSRLYYSKLKEILGNEDF